jgi:hypothetical protein
MIQGKSTNRKICDYPIILDQMTRNRTTRFPPPPPHEAGPNYRDDFFWKSKLAFLEPGLLNMTEPDRRRRFAQYVKKSKQGIEGVVGSIGSLSSTITSIGSKTPSQFNAPSRTRKDDELTLVLGGNILKLGADRQWTSMRSDLEVAEGEITTLIEEKEELLQVVNNCREQLDIMAEELHLANKLKGVSMDLLSKERAEKVMLEKAQGGYKEELKKCYRVILELRKSADSARERKKHLRAIPRRLKPTPEVLGLGASDGEADDSDSGNDGSANASAQKSRGKKGGALATTTQKEEAQGESRSGGQRVGIERGGRGGRLDIERGSHSRSRSSATNTMDEGGEVDEGEGEGVFDFMSDEDDETGKGSAAAAAAATAEGARAALAALAQAQEQVKQTQAEQKNSHGQRRGFTPNGRTGVIGGESSVGAQVQTDTWAAADNRRVIVVGSPQRHSPTYTRMHRHTQDNIEESENGGTYSRLTGSATRTRTGTGNETNETNEADKSERDLLFASSYDASRSLEVSRDDDYTPDSELRGR